MFPATTFDIITYNLNHASFLFRFPYIREGIRFPLFDLELKNIWHPGFWRPFHNALRRIRRNRYDLYISFHHTWMPQWYFLELLLAFLSRSAFRVGINPDYVSNDGVFHRSIKEGHLSDRHYRDFYFDLIRCIGDPGNDFSLEFPLDSHDIEAARALIQSTIPDVHGIVSLHIGASTESKRWPIQNYEALAERLVESGFGIILIGTDRELPLANRIANHLVESSCFNACGQTDLIQTGALIDASDLFIGNDSGPMHIAVARKKPTIGLIGPYHPRFHKYEKNEATIIRNSVTNDAYDAIAVKESDYRWAIPVDRVFSEAMKMLG